MAYRFKLDESFEKGYRRITREQIDRALTELSPLEVGQVGVHQCRKVLKRLRALVRLVGPAIGDKPASRSNAALRKVAHLLAGPRDDAVLLDTIRRVEAAADAETKAELAPLRDRLSAQAPDLSRPLNCETAQQARLMLVKEAKRFAKVKFKASGFDALRPGLEASYRAGRKAMRRAYRKPSDESFHDLRKSVQNHWRHMTLLSRAWPDAFGVRVAAARELSQLLGEDHDMAMLLAAARTSKDLPESAIAATQAHCRSAQATIRADAEHRVERLFAETPSAFCARMAAYWVAGRHIRAAEPPKTVLQSVEAPGAPTLVAVEPGEPGPIAAKSTAATPSQRRA